MTEVGSWIECINPFNNPVNHFFFRHVPSDKRFDRNDVAKLCPICWGKAQMRNGTLQRVTNRDYNAQHEHAAQCTPEKDSL